MAVNNTESTISVGLQTDVAKGQKDLEAFNRTMENIERNLTNIGYSGRQANRNIVELSGIVQQGNVSLTVMALRLQQISEQLAKGAGTTNIYLRQARQIAPVTEANTSAFTKFANTIFKVAVFTTAYRAVRLFQQGLSDSVTSAAEYIIKINEIRSINQETGESFAFISEKITNVSTKFGLDALDVAEGAYQALSNQVAKGAEAFQFLDTAGKLASASVSKISTSVNALSSVINGFGLNNKDAERISAVLFKTVEIGRFRLDELDTAMAKVIPTAHTMGVSFEELSGALAAFTIRGASPEIAATLLNNVLLGLLKPTKEATEFFNENGFATGRAALAALGLADTMKLLNNELQKNPERLAKIANDMRELRGIALTAGQTFEALVSGISQVSNATESFNKAVDINLNNSGRKFKQFQQEIAAGMRAIGGPLLTGYLAAAETFGEGLVIVTGGGKARDIRNVADITAQAVRGMSSTFQAENTAIDASLKKLAQSLQKNLANSAKDAYAQLANVNTAMLAIKQSLKDEKILFFDALKDKIKTAEDAANRAKGVIDAIRGTGGKQGKIADIRAEAVSTQDQRELDAPSVTGRDPSAVQRRRRIEEQIQKIFGNINSPEFQIAGQTVEAIEGNTKRLLQLEGELDKLRGSNGSRLVNHRKISEDISKIYKAQEVALENLAKKEERILKAKQAEADLAKVNEKKASTLVGDVEKFDVSKFDSPAKAQTAFGELLKRVQSQGSIFSQDPKFNTALTTQLSLIKQQLDLTNQIKVSNEENLKVIEAGRKTGQAEIDKLKIQRDAARELAVLKAQEALGKIGNQEGLLNPDNPALQSSKNQLLDFIKDPSKAQAAMKALGPLQEIMDTINARDQKSTFDVSRALQLRQVMTSIQQAVFAIEDSVEVGDSITKIMEELSKSTTTTASSFSQLDQSISPVYAKMAQTESLTKGTLAMKAYAEATASAISALLRLAALDGSPTAAIAESTTPAPGFFDDILKSQRFGGRSFAFGGLGSDTQLAALSPREIVMNPQASTQFYSTLMAMNRGRAPTSMNTGGPASVTNVGDVHISLSGSPSPAATARELHSSIRREIRRQTI